MTHKSQSKRLLIRSKVMKNPIVKKYKDESRWVNYKMVEIDGRLTKVPYAVNGIKASSIDPTMWSTYDEAFKQSPCVGIVFTPTQTLLGIDIDHCLNKETQAVEHDQKETIDKFIIQADSYTEISPSGTGLHIFIELTAPLKLDANRHSPYECYTSGRYFTFTGQIYGELKDVRTMTPEQALQLLSSIGYPWSKTTNVSQNKALPATNTIQNDSIIIEKMFACKKGEVIRKLYYGDTSDYENDVSRADMALCGHLSFWTGKKAEQMERIWINSPLGSREKTQQRSDYRNRTISKAINDCNETYEERVSPPTTDEHSGTDLIPYPALKQIYKDKDILAGYKIAQTLVKKYAVKTIFEKSSEVYVYKDGIYILGESFLRGEIQKILQELVTIQSKREIISKITDYSRTERQDFTNMDRNLINLNNGVLNIKTLELFPHNPDYLFFTKFPVNYIPSADCHIIKKFLSEILNAEDVPIIQEWIGYCLYRKYFIKKAIIFVGEPNTGKTTLLNLLCRLIGTENTSGINLQKISNDKFAIAHFYNKYLNSYDDLSFKDVNDNGAFKIATGGGLITGEYKFGNQFQFENYAKITFCCNKIPNVKDTNDDAYFSRWIIIPFDKQVDSVNKFLIDQMTTDEEMSGLLNFALDGLSRLLAKHDFSYTKNADEIKHEMLRSGSPLATFVFDYLEECPHEWISKEDMYAEYARFAKLTDMPLITAIDFGRKITLYASFMLDSKRDNKTGWRNVGFKNKNIISTKKDQDIEELTQDALLIN